MPVRCSHCKKESLYTTKLADLCTKLAKQEQCYTTTWQWSTIRQSSVPSLTIIGHRRFLFLSFLLLLLLLLHLLLIRQGHKSNCTSYSVLEPAQYSRQQQWQRLSSRFPQLITIDWQTTLVVVVVEVQLSRASLPDCPFSLISRLRGFWLHL